MPEPTTPQLSEDAVREIEARAWVHSYGDERNEAPLSSRKVLLTIAERDALIRDWRAMRAERSKAIEILSPDVPRTDLCDAVRQIVFAHALEKGSAEKLQSQNAALREQLTQAVILVEQETIVLTDYHYYEAEKAITRRGDKAQQQIHLDRLAILRGTQTSNRPQGKPPYDEKA